MATKIYIGDVVRFPAGPGILALPNETAVTCPGKYVLNAKGKHTYRAYAGDVETFTVSARPASRAEVATHEIGTAPTPPAKDDQADDPDATGD